METQTGARNRRNLNSATPKKEKWLNTIKIASNARTGGIFLLLNDNVFIGRSS